MAKRNNSKGKKGKAKKSRKAIDTKKILIVVAVVALIWCLLSQMIENFTPKASDITYAEFEQLAKDGQVESVDIYTSSHFFNVHTKDGEVKTVPNPWHDTSRKDIMDMGLKVNVATYTPRDAAKSFVASLPLYCFLGILIYYLVSSVGTMTKSYIKCATVQDGVTFDKVAGMTEVKEELKFAIDFLRNPKVYRDSGARVPKGMLMVGPPGTGKTLLAKAVAGEAGVPFISVSGSDFCEMFAGLGAKRVRELFAFARANAPCVVFIDEIDSLGSRRTSSTDAVSRDGNQTLNSLLKEMDGIGSILGVFVMAATNTPENLDPALVRPGRFDRRIVVGPPRTKEDRQAIVDVHLHGKFVEDGVTPESISKLVIGCTGAEIEVILNEAVIISLMRGAGGVLTLNDVDEAVTKMITNGTKKKIVRNKELSVVATHEAGHALIMLLNGYRVSKVTIVPSTSGIGGFTMPDMEMFEDKVLTTEEEYRKQIMQMYGGMCAEEVIYKSHSDGCSNDIQKVTSLAKEMVTSVAMGRYKYDISTIDKEKYAEEVSIITDECYNKTVEMLRSNKELLVKLSNMLLDKETIYNIRSIEDIK